MVYQWKTGSKHNVDPQIAGEVCAALETVGQLSAANLVEVSRPEDAPLHSEFEWDDTEAAIRWREHQARRIIGHITVVSHADETNPIRAFFHLAESDPKYESISTIVQQQDKYDQLLQLALKELNSFRRKYSQLEQLSAVFEAIDAATEQST
ncbi:MAG: hypothetical protein J6A79_02445 [Clostridia bacterium]|nr:hypothetical protein [Clostridia bacterium]